MGLSQGPTPIAEPLSTPPLLSFPLEPSSTGALLPEGWWGLGSLTWELKQDEAGGTRRASISLPPCSLGLAPRVEGTQKFPKTDQQGLEARFQAAQDTGRGPGLGRVLPTSAGKGGFRRGLPCLPSMDSMSAVSSPQM